MPTRYLYIIAGPNGAGKTTASLTLLPEFLEIDTFINADIIAKELSPDDVDAVSFEAGRIMLQQIDELLLAGKNFAFETTLAARSYKHFIQRAQAQGYFVILLFFALPTPEMAMLRVKLRVKSGGNNIPEDTIRRRFTRGLHNLSECYWEVVDDVIVYDNDIVFPELKQKKQLGWGGSFLKIHEGLQEAHRRMIEEKRRKGEQIAIMQDGKLVLINP